jgi:acyl-CoA synthetase (NDP forming)
LICDVAEKVGVEFPPFAAATESRLKEVLPDFASISNPLDATGVAVFDMEMYTNSLEAVAEDPGVHLVGVSQDMPEGLDPVHIETAKRVANTVVDAASRFDKPIFLITNVGGSLFEPSAQILRDADIPVVQGTHEGLRAVKHLGEYARSLRSEPGREPQEKESHLDDATLQGLRERIGRSAGNLPAKDAAELFGAYGIEVLRGDVVMDADRAVEAAQRVRFPVVLKVESPDIQHKTEAGGVITGIGDEDSLRAAFSEMQESVKSAAPRAHIEGYLVQPMVTGGVEAIVGSGHSELFGSMIVVGPGGILVELIDRAAVGIVPASRDRLAAMIDETPLGRLLAGYCGTPPADRAALEDLLVRLSHLLMDVGDLIEELDLNPVVVLDEGNGVRVLDVLVVTKDKTTATLEGSG